MQWPWIHPALADLRLVSERAIAAAALFILFWIAAKILEFVIARLHPHAKTSADLVELLGRTAKITLLIVGFVTALGTMHVNVSALVAGLCLGGFALGFALRDVLSNVLAGVLILLYHPFGRGDRISVTGLEGRVTNIDLRYTALDGGDKVILIPNSNLFTNPIIVDRPAVPSDKAALGGI